MATSPTLLWFRQDLRLTDHEALRAAVALGGPVVPVYVWAPEEEGQWRPGAASRWWLHHSLRALDAELRARGSHLIVRIGPSAATLIAVARETGATRVLWQRRWEPSALERDRQVATALRARGLVVEEHHGSLLYSPERLRNRQGAPYRVFTPFYRACLADDEPSRPLPAPARLAAPVRWPRGDALDALGLLPRHDWAEGLALAWTPGAAGAAQRLRALAGEVLADYERGREFPARPCTSRLSPHLHFGELSPRQVWHAVRQQQRRAATPAMTAAGDALLRQILWREFAHHFLVHAPQTPTSPWQPAFADFPWADDRQTLRAWQRGLTGYPLVDAGMRELWRTGWMHNRVRMVVASFLVKHLLQPWLSGARWFWDTLVDADLGNNTFGWQWSAGCGADAAPFFRIFNPALQGRRYDPTGAYVHRWVPELRNLPPRWVHAPSAAPPALLASAGVVLGQTYPRPLVEHAQARAAALAAFARIRG